MSLQPWTRRGLPADVGAVMKALVMFLVGFALSQLAFSQDSPSEIARIEQAFIDAGELEIIHRIDELPSDVLEAFGQRVDWDSMAEWGEHWDIGDVTIGESTTPRRQHMFSAVSDSVAMIIFRTGGWAVITQVIISQRGVEGTCSYIPGDWVPVDYRMIQASVARSREPGWQCQFHQ
jgi:hypothetical protein